MERKKTIQENNQAQDTCSKHQTHIGTIHRYSFRYLNTYQPVQERHLGQYPCIQRKASRKHLVQLREVPNIHCDVEYHQCQDRREQGYKIAHPRTYHSKKGQQPYKKESYPPNQAVRDHDTSKNHSLISTHTISNSTLACLRKSI